MAYRHVEQVLGMRDHHPTPAYLAAQRGSGRVTVNKHGSRLQVSGPYSIQFVKGARALSGRYRPRSRMWSFKMAASQQVLELVRSIYPSTAINMIG